MASTPPQVNPTSLKCCRIVVLQFSLGRLLVVLPVSTSSLVSGSRSVYGIHVQCDYFNPILLMMSHSVELIYAQAKKTIYTTGGNSIKCESYRTLKLVLKIRNLINCLIVGQTENWSLLKYVALQ